VDVVELRGIYTSGLNGVYGNIDCPQMYMQPDAGPLQPSTRDRESLRAPKELATEGPRKIA
jgi:hypothetical protein